MMTAEKMLKYYENEKQLVLSTFQRELVSQAMDEYKYYEELPNNPFFEKKYNTNYIMLWLSKFATRMTGGDATDKCRKASNIKARHLVRSIGYVFSGLSLDGICEWIRLGTHVMPLHSIKVLESYMYSDKAMAYVITEAFNYNYEQYILARDNYNFLTLEGKMIVESTRERLIKYEVFKKLTLMFNQKKDGTVYTTDFESKD